MKLVNYLILFFCFDICSVFAQNNHADFVNPFIGTSNNANTYPGATLPWGMVSINPFNVDHPLANNTAVSYQKGHQYIYGFSQNRLSGVGCPDMSSILIMPSQGALSLDNVKSTYTNEVAKAGYYAVDLLKNNIEVETTVTVRSSISKYKFTQEGNSFVSLNLAQSLSRNKENYLNVISATEIEGYKTEGGFCGRATSHKVYFYLQISKKADINIWENGKVVVKKELSGQNIGGFLSFSAVKNEEVLVKIGLSYVSLQNAKQNLLNEQPGFDFDQVKQNASAAWEKELKRIQVKGGTLADKTMFYTGIYHMMQHPNIISDVNGDYPAMESGKTMNSPIPHYTVFSLWDTYRNVHPFLTLVYPERQSEMLTSMVDMYKESGWLPKWELAARETDVMVGDPATIVIADSYLKGIKDFDIHTAYQGMLNSANTTIKNPLRPGLNQYLQKGYIPNDDKDGVWGSVSTTLEYAFADWSLAQVAKQLGDQPNFEQLNLRANHYKNLFDKNKLLMRPKLSSGQWLKPFDPLTMDGEQNYGGSGGPGFVEGTAWQYTWFVPYDIKGMIKLMGGKKKFTAQLQLTFDQNYFSISNEPDMAYPYLFNYIKGQESRTQNTVSQYISKYYNTTSAGIPGNDDCGALSAWLVFGMMGIYPDCPASDSYAITTPYFDEININLNTTYYPSSTVTIQKIGTGANIKNITQNNQAYPSYFLKHQDLVKGGVIQIFTK